MSTRTDITRNQPTIYIYASVIGDGEAIVSHTDANEIEFVVKYNVEPADITEYHHLDAQVEITSATLSISDTSKPIDIDTDLFGEDVISDWEIEILKELESNYAEDVACINFDHD